MELASDGGGPDELSAGETINFTASQNSSAGLAQLRLTDRRVTSWCCGELEMLTCARGEKPCAENQTLALTIKWVILGSVAFPLWSARNLFNIKPQWTQFNVILVTGFLVNGKVIITKQVQQSGLEEQIQFTFFIMKLIDNLDLVKDQVIIDVAYTGLSQKI